jgi:hypothetical protein
MHLMWRLLKDHKKMKMLKTVNIHLIMKVSKTENHQTVFHLRMNIKA